MLVGNRRRGVIMSGLSRATPTKERSKQVKRVYLGTDVVGNGIYFESWFPPENLEPMWRVTSAWIRSREQLMKLRNAIDNELALERPE
jgi:hypothetical protein